MRKISALVLVLLSVSSGLFAQTGSLQGKVTDAETKEGVSFATVMLLRGGNVVNGVVADMDGEYAIKPIDPGTYDLKVFGLSTDTIRITGVQINSDKITFQNITLGSGATTLTTVVVSSKKLVDPDVTYTGSTANHEEIQQMAINRSNPNNIAAQTAGVFQFDNNSGLFVNGSRGYSQKYYVDGIPMVGAISLPTSAIEQLTTITGGIPARYGDATGGIINITTRGPSKDFHGGFELGSGYFIDYDKYRLVSFNLSGPIFTKYKESKGTKNDSSDAKIGFFLSGEYAGSNGGRSAVDYWKVKDNILDRLEKYPLTPAPNGSGFIASASYITKDSMERIKVLPNSSANSFRASGKIDYKLNKYITLTFGGNVNWSESRGIGWLQQLFDPNVIGYSTSGTYRGFARFTQRFGSGKTGAEKTSSVFQNAYYSIQVDYTKNRSKSEDPNKGFDPFKYGYIGKFKTYRAPAYFPGTDTLFNSDGSYKIYYGAQLFGYRDTLVTYQPVTDINELLTNYTKQYYELAGSEPIDGIYGLQNRDNKSYFYGGNQYTYYSSLTNIVTNGGMLNSLTGFGSYLVYSMWYNTGVPLGGYGIGNSDQYHMAFNGSVDIVKPSAKGGEKNRHALEFGLEYEQRVSSGYSVSPINLWGLARQLANKHIQTLDTDNPIFTYDANGIFTDTINYNRKVGNDQSFFDLSLRRKLGLDEHGTDFIDVDAIDPSVLSLDMFSPDELNGNNLSSKMVSATGYDYYGNRLNKNPSFDDFFTQKDANGNYTRPLAPNRPIYAAAYLQDKFNFRDLIFNIGLRVDRYDANQKVLKDPYSLFAVRTVGEVTDLDGKSITHPSNIGNDYVVYVDQQVNPGKIVGYRDGNNWYTADGSETQNPGAIALSTSKGKIMPYLVDNTSDSLVVSSDAFTDFTPVFTFMPRIAFSFPISDEALFFAHYDVLSQRPVNNVATPYDYYFLRENSVLTTIGNPALKPERTIDYQVGFTQGLGRTSSLTISGIYRELKDMVQIKKYAFAFPVDYNTYGNEDFGTVKSLQITYNLNRTRNVSIEANYTLQFADGTGDSPGSSGALINLGEKVKPVFPFYYDQRHTIKTSIDYRFSEGKFYNGPVVGKNNTPILANTGLNIIFSAGSGTPYSKQANPTPNGVAGLNSTSAAKGTINGSRLPWSFRFDLKIDKSFKVGQKTDKHDQRYVNAYFLIGNVLNTKNVFGVYAYTGNPDNDGYLASPIGQLETQNKFSPQAFIDMYNIRNNAPGNYSSARSIRCGLMFNF